jgi:hypothetical protein
MSSSQKSIAPVGQTCAGRTVVESLSRLVVVSTLFVALMAAAPAFGQSPEKAVPANSAEGPGAPPKSALDETIDQLKSQGKTEEATFLTKQQERANAYGKSPEPKKWGVIFGRLVAAGSDKLQLCDAQMAIHPSGWFAGDVGDIEKPVEFRMWGYHPVLIKHGGLGGATVNVGDIVLKPFLFDELATVRAELLFEGKVDPAAVSVSVMLQHPPVNSRSGGTDGNIPWPEKEAIAIGPDFRIQRTGLNPMPHYFFIKAPGHLPFRREFNLEPGATADLGVLRIAASPAFEVEFAIADGLDFTKAERRQQTVHAGDPFKTNPAGKEWVEAGTLEFQEKKRAYTFRCRLASLIVTDLGEGTLDDHLKPVHRERERGQPVEPPALVDGHVYLITHSMQKMWKHSTLMRVKMQSGQ